LKENYHTAISEAAEKVASLTGLAVSNMFKVVNSIKPLVRFRLHKKKQEVLGRTNCLHGPH
jgi:hypothetical protein